MARYFNHHVVDEFLTESLHDRLLRYVLDNARAFSPTRVYSQDNAQGGAIDEGLRRSLVCSDGLGPLKPSFKEAILSALPNLVAALDGSAFENAGMELELVAHRHGSFFRPHIDTRTQLSGNLASERMVTIIYYFHAQPRRFSGGEIAILPIGPGDPVLIEPRDNRLVAFASFVPHEVRPVTCHPDEFRHSRFAINCWVHRQITRTPT